MFHLLIKILVRKVERQVGNSVKYIVVLDVKGRKFPAKHLAKVAMQI